MGFLKKDILFILLATPCDMQDHSSPTWDGTWAPCSGSVESQLLDQEASLEGNKHVLPTSSTTEVEGIAIVSGFGFFPVIHK